MEALEPVMWQTSAANIIGTIVCIWAKVCSNKFLDLWQFETIASPVIAWK